VVVRDAWRQCRRRPLAIALIVVLAYVSPGTPGPDRTVEVHGWAAVALVPLSVTAALLTAVGLLFPVAYLGGALRDQPSGVREALGVTRRMLWPGLAGFVVTWAAVIPASGVAAVVGLALWPPGIVEEASQPGREYVLRLLVMGPLLAAAVGLLAVLVPRIVLEGERDLGRAVGLSLRVAGRALPVCLLIGLLQAAPMVARIQPPLPLTSPVWALLALVTLVGMAMANALLWHTRAWQLDGSERPARPSVPG
jgi:hypothetical protein